MSEEKAFSLRWSSAGVAPTGAGCRGPPIHSPWDALGWGAANCRSEWSRDATAQEGAAQQHEGLALFCRGSEFPGSLAPPFVPDQVLLVSPPLPAPLNLLLPALVPLLKGSLASKYLHTSSLKTTSSHLPTQVGPRPRSSSSGQAPESTASSRPLLQLLFPRVRRSAAERL